MKKAEMKVIRFDANDVIATSSFVLAGLGNGISGDATFKGKLLSSYEGTENDEIGIFLDITDPDKKSTNYTPAGLASVFDLSNNNGSEWNGTYTLVTDAKYKNAYSTEYKYLYNKQ